MEASDGPAVQRLESDAPFSVFTKWQKRGIGFAVSFAGMFSTLSSCIYMPVLVPIARDLQVSLTLMNLTVTYYLIVAGIAPAFMGDMADQSGRRPVYVLMLTLMTGANVGMAVCQSYAVLCVLRCVQSAGASGMVSVAYGVLSDIASIEERGSYVGTFILMTSMAPSLGPVLGGVFAAEKSWRWIFWLLVIITGTTFFVLLLFLPETQRKLVGNGSKPVKGIYWCLTTYLIKDKIGTQHVATKRKHQFPSPLSSLIILRDKGSLTLILIGSLAYVNIMTLQTSLAALCIEIYDLDYLQAGLIYLPGGIASGVGSFVTGKLLDWNYRRITLRFENEALRPNPHVAEFPIESARLEGMYTLIAVSALSTVGYGLVLMAKTHIAVMLLMQVLASLATSSIFTIISSLITDYNPHKTATAQAAYNFVRCLGAGAGIAALQPLFRAIGSGWTFAVYAFIGIFQMLALWILKRHGTRWRESKRNLNILQRCS